MKRYKKLGLLLITFMVLMISGGKTVSAAGYTSEDGEWTYVDLIDGTIQLQGYNGDKKVEELVIPGVVDEKVVSSLGAVCKDMTNLKRVTIPDTVTELFTNTFRGCTSLENFTVPDHVQEVGSNTFLGCSNLKSVVIPDSVIEIESSVFEDCISLESVVISNNVTVLSNGVFYKCRNLKTINLPSKLKKIGHGCFQKSGIESITFPDTLEEIGQCAFSGCTSLTSVKIPTKVKVLCGSTFLGCTSLASAIVPPSVEKSGIENVASDGNDHSNLQIFPSTTVIYGHSGSFIAEQAATYGNPFVDSKYVATVKTEPTCTTYGVTEMFCPTCNYRYTATPSPLGHHMVDTPMVPATCDAPGHTAGKQCDRCGQAGAGVQEISQIGQIKLTKSTYTYNGKAKKPAVKVKDMNDSVIAAKNYTVSYSGGRKKIGKYKVTIVFQGSYTGTVTKTFMVTPKKVSIKGLQAGSKSLTVKWSGKASQVSGYQVQLATNKKFTKNVKTSEVNKKKQVKKKQVTKTIKKLKSKKKYYVRVRAYKTVKFEGKKTKIYSGWSKAKSIKVK